MVVFLVGRPSRSGGSHHQLLWPGFGRRGSLLGRGLCRCGRWARRASSFGAASILWSRFWSSRGCWPAHWHSLNISGCRPGFQCRPSALACTSGCSRIWCICPQFHLHCTWFRAGEETMLWPSLLQHARWTWLGVYYNSSCSRSSTYYRFHQRQATARQGSTWVHTLLTYDPLILQNSHFSASCLYVEWSCLLSRCSGMSCSKQRTLFFLRGPWTFWQSFAFGHPSFAGCRWRYQLRGSCLSWTRTHLWWCLMDPNRTVWLPLKSKHSTNIHRSRDPQRGRFHLTSPPDSDSSHLARLEHPAPWMVLCRFFFIACMESWVENRYQSHKMVPLIFSVAVYPILTLAYGSYWLSAPVHHIDFHCQHTFCWSWAHYNSTAHFDSFQSTNHPSSLDFLYRHWSLSPAATNNYYCKHSHSTAGPAIPTSACNYS